jgi:hypothetical protein
MAAWGRPAPDLGLQGMGPRAPGPITQPRICCSCRTNSSYAVPRLPARAHRCHPRRSAR